MLPNKKKKKRKKKEREKFSRKYFLKIVNVQINGATISLTNVLVFHHPCILCYLWEVQRLSTPHIRNILDSLFYISISSGEKIALRNYQTGLLFSIEGELPNWPISPFSPSSSNTKARPFELSHF